MPQSPPPSADAGVVRNLTDSVSEAFKDAVDEDRVGADGGKAGAGGVSAEPGGMDRAGSAPDSVSESKEEAEDEWVYELGAGVGYDPGDEDDDCPDDDDYNGDDEGANEIDLAHLLRSTTLVEWPGSARQVGAATGE